MPHEHVIRVDTITIEHSVTGHRARERLGRLGHVDWVVSVEWTVTDGHKWNEESQTGGSATRMPRLGRLGRLFRVGDSLSGNRAGVHFKFVTTVEERVLCQKRDASPGC